MAFVLSKLFWLMSRPGNVLLLLLCLAAVLVWTRWRRWAHRLIAGLAGAAVVVAVVPVGEWILAPLEERFPVPQSLPPRVDGIIVLGGVVDAEITGSRGSLALDQNAERLFAGIALARTYPEARLVFTGGSGRLFGKRLREAHFVPPAFAAIGLAPERVVYEDRSRTTHENALFSKQLVAPAADETWIVVTSANHMPRAVGCFRQIGWPVLAYPVDFRTPDLPAYRLLRFDLAGGLDLLAGGLHEWLGLLFYWFDGRTDALFPAAES
jgi:uncharacterized SAM-binding protein YcdF (DUF218 family)